LSIQLLFVATLTFAILPLPKAFGAPPV